MSTEPDDPLDAAFKLELGTELPNCLPPPLLLERRRATASTVNSEGQIGNSVPASPREIGGSSAWFLSAEAIAVFKLLFFRAKDLVDLERLVALRSELDVAYVRRQIVAMMDESDERVEKWDQIVRAAR